MTFLRSTLLALLLVNPAPGQEAKGRVFRFPLTGVAFDARFDGARLNDCTQIGPSEYRATIRPENRPINNSPWYAFRVTSESARTITVRLEYDGGSHRYRPKTSTDGAEWEMVADEAYAHSKQGATVRLDVGPEPLWVSAQEMIGVKELGAWVDQMASVPFVEKSTIGPSTGGRPIWKLEMSEGEPRGTVVIIGRQHPPEVTGSIALMRFVETVAGPTELAARFRKSVDVLVVPLVNPDGVAAGHWRSNLGKVDLNRDWGPWRQPETRAVRDEILKHHEAAPVYLLLDFHSTHRDLFYVQTEAQPTRPAGFTGRWLEGLSRRLPEYTVREAPTAGTKPTSKKWGYETFGAPSITYEVGDNTDRDLIRQVARSAAEEMMQLLLAEVGREGASHAVPAAQR